MMHHPNMHHQPMSGHPPQHMGGHQGMPAHHQMPPHQMHRENRHVTLTRVPLGPSQSVAGNMGGHGHGPGPGQMGVGLGVPHNAPRAPHPIRPMPHHPPAPAHHQNHNMPPQMKPLRRPYVSGGYGPGGGVVHSPYAPAHHHQPAPAHAPQPAQQPQTHHTAATTLSTSTPASATIPSTNSTTEVSTSAKDSVIISANSGGTNANASANTSANATASGDSAAGDGEAARPAAPANSKEKTPMCLVNELARYNKIQHQYRLTSETGPAHKKVFTVTLRLGDTEEYTAEGSSIKRAQHAAASAALGGTRYPGPPPRAAPPHSHHHAHHRHSGADTQHHNCAVMPTVELNALAMKLCQPAVYSSVPPVAGPTRGPRARGPGPGAGPGAFRGGPFAPFPRLLTPPLIYRVRVSVGGRAWLGEGSTPQAARHDAAARALQELRPPPDASPDPPPPDTDNGESATDLLNSEVKSPVSLVHELALKRNLSVQFSVKSERGPPHMRVFVTLCTVGEMETEGEGNGKKVSKRRAAERMLDEMRRRWPPALLRPRPHHDKRRLQPTKKKPRNLIKEGGVCAGEGACGSDNPISRLAVARHAVRARSPQYRVVEERGAARRREFLVQCDAPPHSATGLGPNKKTAKRRAAHNVLLAMEMSTNSTDSPTSPVSNNTDNSNTSVDSSKSKGLDSKRKESEASSGLPSGGASSEVRQPVPGVLMMDYHQRTGQPQQPNGVSETSATGGSGGNTPGAKDQLMYLSQLLGFTVQFSDFPKRNHGEYLSLVSLSTVPPVMVHGGGPSTAHSHEQCARAALRALKLMGLDANSQHQPPSNNTQLSVAGSKTGVLSNGIAE
ncbi:hypothetical protein K1T71_002089 [Dendrolimus kikuchii]|uniref:Uncharacterized protein n=1 Tax=Dendrolimus kikuchii TaxID=765133 RepID=A0ACC1DFW9_9NEOP|nr:hypothetical protein K1T71_002089 [Dendrolimus kikuchii]